MECKNIGGQNERFSIIFEKEVGCEYVFMMRREL